MNEASIFAAAVEKTSDQERAAYLAEACAGDEKLRRRVEILLRAHAEPDELLDQSAAKIGTVNYVPLAEGPGTVIGPYKLLQQIGEGGFGVVYMTEQTHPVRRMVALKIIKPGMDTAQVIARFESERQALALMDHPNIARVFDAGSTASGRPYFVMELVKGVPITDFCDKNLLSPEARLGLFLDLCHAIQHAHHKGVIHRDIKPSNVMVTLHDGVAVVKVIDFGVAKAMGLKLTDRTFFTAYGQMIGTPAYMSPEQAEMSGLDIDTRSDVYALGVLLYELLTGTTPLEGQRLRQAAYTEMQRLIREEEAPRPSTRMSSLGGSATVMAGNRGLDVKRLVQLLAGDLDWLVMKALEKDRNRRYDTPGSFAEDIERYLHREAIMARPPSMVYKIKKFTQRNRAAVFTTVLVAASLILGIVLTSWQAVRATVAEGLAKEALAQAKIDRERALEAELLASERLKQVTHEKQQAAEAVAQSEIDRAWAQEVGELAAARLTQNMNEKERAEKALAEATSERGKAERMSKVGVQWSGLWFAAQLELKGAFEAAERQYRSEIEIARAGLGPDRGGTTSTLALCGFYSRRNTPEKGEPLLRELLASHKLHPQAKPEEEAEVLYRILGALGLNLLEQHKWVDAEKVLRECLTACDRLDKSIRERTAGHHIPSVGWTTRSMLGQSLVGQKKYAEAEHYLMDGYKGGKDLVDTFKGFGGDPGVLFPMLPIKETMERLVQLYEAWEKPDEAAKWRKELEAFNGRG
ncbi:MAG TPA: protein kinase [Chloroflexota bacterium]|nr:protein kinase [Chloroflexota bacterium]